MGLFKFFSASCQNPQYSGVFIAAVMMARVHNGGECYAIHAVDYTEEGGWEKLTKAEQEQGMAAYTAYTAGPEGGRRL